MARVTLYTICARALMLADIPFGDDTATGNAYSAGELQAVANEGLAELRDLLVEAWEGFLATDDTVKMRSGERYTTLPDDFFKLQHLYLIEGSQRIEIDPWGFEELSGTETTETDSYPRYQVRGNRIVWHPLPASDRDVEMWYVRQFKDLTHWEDEISPEIPRGWESFVVAHIAEYVLTRQERDTRPATMMRERARQHIISSASNRDASRPRVTPDVSGRYRRRRNFPLPRV